MIDLVALRSLLALEDHGTVSAAAQATGYTPSAVSQQIKRMERDLGVVLLERVGRGVVLTDPGRLLVEHGRGILRHLEAAMSGLRADEGDPRGPLRIAAFSTAVRGLVAPLVADLLRSAPEVIPEVTERDPVEVVELVVSGQTDLGVVHNWVGVPLHRPEHLRGELIGSDVADLLVHRENPLAGHSFVTPADLLTQPWGSTPPGSICHAWFTHMFAGFPAPPPVRFWSMEWASHVRLVEEGVSVALVPRLGRGPLPAAVVPVEVRDPVPTRLIELLWRESMSASPALTHARARLRAIHSDSTGDSIGAPPPMTGMKEGSSRRKG
jgi:DNA-binding transcriptional LysR family regulator